MVLADLAQNLCRLPSQKSDPDEIIFDFEVLMTACSHSETIRRHAHGSVKRRVSGDLRISAAGRGR